jgi:hypothetical protein
VVLVENDPVEPQLLAVGHFFEVFVIICSPLHGIEIAARHGRARRFLRNVGIGEEVKVIELHSALSPWMVELRGC